MHVHTECTGPVVMTRKRRNEGRRSPRCYAGLVVARVAFGLWETKPMRLMMSSFTNSTLPSCVFWSQAAAGMGMQVIDTGKKHTELLFPSLFRFFFS